MVAILTLGVQKGVITETLGRKSFGNPIHYYGLRKSAEKQAEEEKKLAEQIARVNHKLEQAVPHVPEPTPAEVKAFTERIKRIKARHPEETLDKFMAGIDWNAPLSPADLRARQAEVERMIRRETDLQETQREEERLEQSRRKRLPQAMLGEEHNDKWDDAIDRLLEELEIEEEQRQMDDDSTK